MAWEKPPSAQQRCGWPSWRALGKQPADFPAFLRLMEELGCGQTRARRRTRFWLRGGSCTPACGHPPWAQALIRGHPGSNCRGTAHPGARETIRLPAGRRSHHRHSERRPRQKMGCETVGQSLQSKAQMAAALQYLREHELTDYAALSASTEAAVDRFFTNWARSCGTPGGPFRTTQLMGATVDWQKRAGVRWL